MRHQFNVFLRIRFSFEFKAHTNLIDVAFFWHYLQIVSHHVIISTNKQNFFFRKIYTQKPN